MWLELQVKLKNMEIVAKAQNVRVTPRKLRMVADLIRKMKPAQAITTLGFLPKSGAEPMLKTLNAGIANAKNNFKKNISELSIKKVFVDEGIKMKRQDKSHSAKSNSGLKVKKSAHITIVLEA